MLRQSYVHGASDVPLIGETIGAFLDQASERWGEREALVVCHQSIRWTYTELKQQADAFAAGLLALGLKSGDRVGIWSPNNSEWVVAQYATAKAGMILVTINPAYRIAELEYALNKVGCAALITAASFKTSDYIAMLTSLMPEIAACPAGKLEAARVPSLRTLICIGADRPGFVRFDTVSARANAADRDRLAHVTTLLQFDDPISVQFTSGTTGAPKGATLSHHSILNNGFFQGEAMGMTPDDRFCVPLPLYHCGGMVNGTLACLTHGSCMILPSEWFDPLATLEAIETELCTVLAGVPTMFIAQLNHPRFTEFDFGSLRTGWMGGAPCPVEVMRRCIEEMHLGELTIIFGMTETSPVCLQTAVDDPMQRRVGSVGRIHPHVEVKVVDAQGRIVPPGTPGEFLTRGYSVMLGYWGDPEKTRESIDAAGWMHTGDMGTLDAQGYGNVVGRIKDMVIRGGENIYPREIEEFLYQHPGIANAQVFGVPDDRFGEELCAWVQLKDGVGVSETDIRDFCREQIAYYKIPRYIRFVDEFPMTVTGKMQKFAMREWMARELGLSLQKTA